MNAHVPPQTIVKSNPETEWILARARSISAGIRLVLAEIDEIGISLKNGWITPERAQADLAALEQLPVYVASIFLRPVESGAA
jgi:hypothetical protein